MIGPIMSLETSTGEKCTGEERQATICSNVVVAVPVLTRKARTVQERRAVLPEIIVFLLKSSFFLNQFVYNCRILSNFWTVQVRSDVWRF
jgi:hypothetical protein